MKMEATLAGIKPKPVQAEVLHNFEMEKDNVTLDRSKLKVPLPKNQVRYNNN
jgi:hypothetical protein